MAEASPSPAAAPAPVDKRSFLEPLQPLRPPRTLYFAYGSDMQIAYMARTCPSSRYIGRAVLTDYKWHINKLGFANLTKVKTAHAPGLVYEVDEDDKARLEEKRFPLYKNVYVEAELYPAPFCLFRRQSAWITQRGGPEAVLEEAFATGRGNDRRASYTEKNILVFMSLDVVIDGRPDARYAEAINAAAADAMALGIDALFFEKIVQQFMPGRMLPYLRVVRRGKSASPDPGPRNSAPSVVVARAGNSRSVSRGRSGGGGGGKSPSSDGTSSGDRSDDQSGSRNRSTETLPIILRPPNTDGGGDGGGSSSKDGGKHHSKSLSESIVVERPLTPVITISRPSSAANDVPSTRRSAAETKYVPQYEAPRVIPVHTVTQGTVDSSTVDKGIIDKEPSAATFSTTRRDTVDKEKIDKRPGQEQSGESRPKPDAEAGRIVEKITQLLKKTTDEGRAQGQTTVKPPDTTTGTGRAPPAPTRAAPPPSAPPPSAPAPVKSTYRKTETQPVLPRRRTRPHAAGPARRPLRRPASICGGRQLSRFDRFLLKAAEHPHFCEKPWIPAFRARSRHVLATGYQQQRRMSF